MRRPSTPAQRAAPPDSSSQRADAPVSPRADERVAPVELSPRREPVARVTAPREQRPVRREKNGMPAAPRPEPRDPHALPSPASRVETWRTLRRAAGARRKVERTEARRFTARTRRRRQLQLAIAAFVVLVIGGAVVTAYSPVMALRHIEVVGAHNVKATQVQHALAGELGTPLPLVNSSAVRHALDDFRLIESYSTQLEPPSTLVVRITERTPLAVVQSGTSYEVVDQAGVVLSAGSTPQPGLPVITVPAGQEPDHSAGFAAAAAVVAALPDSVRSTVTAATATDPNDVTLTLSGGKQVIWGGSGQMELKAADLQALLKGAASASVYDVSSPNAPITR